VAPRAADVAVVGAGSFGAWTAWWLRQKGRSVVLVDQHSPGNTRASSGGESRVIRMGYGADELYTRFSMRSLPAWKRLFAEAKQPALFVETGVLWLARAENRYAKDTLGVLERQGVRHERLTADELRKRYPQMRLPEEVWGLLEPESGALLARRAVQAVAADAVRNGVEYRPGAISPPRGRGRLESLPGLEDVRAGSFVFACGPWLPKVFPELLGDRIFPTRQEVFFFGPPPGDASYSAGRFPAWIDFGEEIYGLPDIEGRGFKVAPDRHGQPFDPDTGERIVSQQSLAAVRDFLARRFPALAAAPLLESRVCQYENTSNGDFLVDRHPDLENVWLVGGGSGHGFKHGPAVGEHVADRVLGEGMAEPRFSLATKQTVQKRAVY
jgi:monomeric sarcosine oxidase